MSEHAFIGGWCMICGATAPTDADCLDPAARLPHLVGLRHVEPHAHLGWSINSDAPMLAAHMRDAHGLVSDDPLLHVEEHRT